MLHRIHLLKLEERRKGHPNKPAPKIRPFVVVPKDRPTVYKPPSSVSSGTSFSSRKNDFGETATEPKTSNPFNERVPITIPIHKPVGSDVTSRRESFRVRPSLDRQSISRAGLIGRATLDTGRSVARAHTGQKRRLEEVLAQEFNAPTHQDNSMEIDTLPLETQSIRSSTSIYSYNQSRHETSTYRSMVTEEVQESVISRRLASPPSQNTPDATIDDRMSRSTPVRDASPISHIQRQPSPHSTHISPIHSPSLQLQRQPSPHSTHISPIRSPSLQSQRQLSPHSIHQSPPSVSSRKSSISARSSRQSSVAPVEHERRSTSVHSRTASPVSQPKASSVIHDMEMTLDENMEQSQRKDTTEAQQTEYITITEKDGLKDNESSHHEDEVLENVTFSSNSEEVKKRETSVHVEDYEQEANVRDSMSQISVQDNTDEVLSPKEVTITDNNSTKKPQSPIVDSNSQHNETIVTNREEPTRSTVEPTVNTFHIDADDDIDYYDYTIQESEVGESSQGEYLGDITTEEISMRAKDITAAMETQLNRLVASKLGNLHVESLHQLTTEAVRTLRNKNTDPYARSVIEDFVTKLSESYDKCHADYNEYLKITNSREKLEKLANSTRYKDAAIERERLQIQRKLEKSNKEISSLDKKIEKLEELDDFWGSVKRLVNPNQANSSV